ncbi:MAG: hypothetical protein L3K17_06990 [Thermoplasmata archaeon]|nr:hypothetical protein [Thermoplasmata archaeon]
MFGGDPDRPPPTMAPRSRQRAVMLGLLLAFIGLAATIEVVPLAPPQFPGDVAALAIGLVGLLSGGILLGYGVGNRRPRAK